MSIGPLTLERPLEIDDARVAARRLADQRRQSENDLEMAVTLAAQREQEYRKALAQAFAKNAGGDTAAAREAQARSDASQAAYERDLSAGMVKVQQERLRGLEGERSQLKTLMEWSARMNEQGIG